MAFNKNPPWQRNAGMQAIVSFPQAAQPVFNQNIGLQQQQNLSLLPQMGLQQQHLYPQTVQYPTSRPINTIAFQNQAQSQPSVQMSQNSSKFNPNQRVFSGTGHVTKVQNDFGFIDEEVFFHKNVCKGSFPKVGDRVLVEAAYNQNMPFKWNATRVQVLQSAISGSSSNNSSSRHVSSYGSSGHMSGSERSSGRNRYSPSRRSSPDRHSHRSSNHDSRQRDVDDDDRRRRRDDRDNDRYRDKHRERTPDRDRRERDRSPVRKSSPKRRKVRPIPRYMVQMPKHILTLVNADILELRRRYLTLYIPSDFFTSKIRWVEAFPPNEPFSIRKPCTFHVMHKDVEPLLPVCDTELEPADADYLYSAKVMLMSTPSMDEFFQKCFTSAEERDRHEDDRDHIHPTRLINFLVGMRGKNETMAIGGPWSPSLDGDNPHSNPNVLIKTAIRTCKGLTGIDLSSCTRWYRFVELYYRRSETYHKGRLIPARIETVVIFLPDVRSCQPTRLEWTELQLSYKSHLERIVNSQNSDNQPVATESNPSESTSGPVTTGGGEDATTTSVADPEPDPASSSTESAAAAEAESAESSTIAAETSTSITVSSEDQPLPAETGDEMEKDETDGDAKEKKPCPTNFVLLDVKKLKVAELRFELEARGLPIDGIKNVLTKRLDEALQREKEASLEKADASESPAEGEPDRQKPENKAVDEDFETMDNVDMSEVTVIDEYDSTKTEEKSSEDAETATAEPVAKPEPIIMTEKERQLLEKRYSLPEQPHIIVHPSRSAKSGKFDCAVMSLSVLLDYRSEDSKEHSFEVSFFAELFNEMLTRDFGFHIYQALYLLPSKAEDETKKDVSATGDESTEAGDSKKANGDEKSNEDEDTKVKADKDKDRTREKDSRDSRKRSRFDDPSDDDRRRREKEKDKDRVKLYTADRDLLLSFSYFDVSHCGYIFEKDIEDLFYTLGLNLSRSQIRKVVAKAVTRDSLYYRKLTDKPQKNIEESEEAKDKETDESVSNADEPADKQQSTQNEASMESELDKIAIGNTNYLEQMKNSLEQLLKSEDGPSVADNEPQGEKNIPQTLSGLVLHEGGMLNIPKLLKQMKQSEKTREDAEQQLLDVRRQNVELVRNNSRANEKIKDQTSDIKSLTRKLIDAEQNLREITKKSNEYFSALSNIYDRVSTVVHRSESKRSSSIASSKRGSSRDASSRKETKSKAIESESSKESVAGTSTPDVQKMEDDTDNATMAGNETKSDTDGKTSEELGSEPAETNADVEMEQK